MPGANNALIGALRAEASLDAGKFVDGARKIRQESKQTEATVKSSFSGIGAALKAGIAGFVGTLSVGAFTQLIRSSLEYAGSLAEIAQQLGVTTKDLQTFRYMAGQVGVSQEQLETGLSKLTITLGKVAAGAEAPTKALQAIGITAKELANVDTGTAFRMISDGLQKVTDRSQRAAVEVALFGKTGSMLDNMLAGGSDQINELSAAAERLGIVLSDEQIRKADDTADKLEALKTVLAAQIAGVVADNADSIYKLADSITQLVSQLPGAIRGLKAFYASFLDFSANTSEKFDQVVEHPLNRLNPLTAPFRGGQMHANRLRNIQADRAEAHHIRQQVIGDALEGGMRSRGAPAARPVGPPIEEFLAPKGGGHKAAARHGPTDRSEDTTYQFQREQMQADADILRAKQQLAHNADDRLKIELQIIELERQMAGAEIDDHVRRAQRDNAEGRITADALRQAQAQAAILRSKNDEAARLRAQAAIDERIHQQKEDQARLVQVDLDLQQDALRAQLQLATTASERRDIELRLLDLAERQERARLDAVIADEQSSDAAKEEARRRLAALSSNHSAAVAGVFQNTRDPLEEWAARVPKTAAEITESLRSIEADGLDDLSDNVTDVGLKFLGLADQADTAAGRIIKSILGMITKMLIFRTISSIFGGAFGGNIKSPDLTTPWGVNLNTSSLVPSTPGFARGGSFGIGGNPGIDRNTLSMNGLPIARVSMGERISIGNDNYGGGRGDVTIHQTYQFEGVAITQQQFMQGLLAAKAATLAAINDRNRRR